MSESYPLSPRTAPELRDILRFVKVEKTRARRELRKFQRVFGHPSDRIFLRASLDKSIKPFAIDTWSMPRVTRG